MPAASDRSLRPTAVPCGPHPLAGFGWTSACPSATDVITEEQIQRAQEAQGSSGRARAAALAHAAEVFRTAAYELHDSQVRRTMFETDKLVAQVLVSPMCVETDALRLCAWAGWLARTNVKALDLVHLTCSLLLKRVLEDASDDDAGVAGGSAVVRRWIEADPFTTSSVLCAGLSAPDACARFQAVLMGLTWAGESVPESVHSYRSDPNESHCVDGFLSLLAAAVLAPWGRGEELIPPALENVVRTWLVAVPAAGAAEHVQDVMHAAATVGAAALERRLLQRAADGCSTASPQAAPARRSRAM